VPFASRLARPVGEEWDGSKAQGLGVGSREEEPAIDDDSEVFVLGSTSLRGYGTMGPAMQCLRFDR
jgi:hypothetical protein